MVSIILYTGVLPEYVESEIQTWNEDMRSLDARDRIALYEEMVTTSKEKFVRGWDLVRCKFPGGPWIRRRNLDPVRFTKKERSKPYPASTTEEEQRAARLHLDSTQLDYEYSSVSKLYNKCDFLVH